jgi:ammonia channel protein AmtB
MWTLGYLDPGAGSMVVQAIVAGFAGLAVVLRLGWRRMKLRIRPQRAEVQDLAAESDARDGD